MLRDLQIRDTITIYVPGEAAEEEVEILYIPQRQEEQWIFRRNKQQPNGNDWLIGIKTNSPIYKL